MGHVTSAATSRRRPRGRCRPAGRRASGRGRRPRARRRSAACSRSDGRRDARAGEDGAHEEQGHGRDPDGDETLRHREARVCEDLRIPRGCATSATAHLHVRRPSRCASGCVAWSLSKHTREFTVADTRRGYTGRQRSVIRGRGRADAYRCFERRRRPRRACCRPTSRTTTRAAPARRRRSRATGRPGTTRAAAVGAAGRLRRRHGRHRSARRWRRPILVAPTALHAARASGRRGRHGGAPAAGSLLVLSARCRCRWSASLRRAVVVPGVRDAGRPQRRADRARGAGGVSALVLTGDTPYVGIRHAPTPGVDPNALHLANLASGPGPAPRFPESVLQDPSITEASIPPPRRAARAAELVKGVLRADGAERCVAAGAAGWWFRTTGAGTSIAPCRRRMRSRRSWRRPAACRCSSTAGSLGDGRARGAGPRGCGRAGGPADGVGLAADGTEGVERCLRTLQEDLGHVLALAGATSPGDLRPAWSRRDGHRAGDDWRLRRACRTSGTPSGVPTPRRAAPAAPCRARRSAWSTGTCMTFLARDAGAGARRRSSPTIEWVADRVAARRPG